MFNQDSSRSSLADNYSFSEGMFPQEQSPHSQKRNSRQATEAYQQDYSNYNREMYIKPEPTDGQPQEFGMPMGAGMGNGIKLENGLEPTPFVDQMYPMSQPMAQFPSQDSNDPYIKSEFQELPIGYSGGFGMGPSDSFGNPESVREEYGMNYDPYSFQYGFQNQIPPNQIQQNQVQQNQVQQNQIPQTQIQPNRIQANQQSQTQSQQVQTQRNTDSNTAQDSRIFNQGIPAQQKGNQASSKRESKPSSSKQRDTQETESIKSSPEPEEKKGKSAHNVIEQRYRNKINYKFTMLQNSVPTLRAVARNKRDDGSEDDEEAELEVCGEENLEGLEPARKLNKGTILSKSLEYIKFLENKHEQMLLEHRQLAERLRALGYNVEEA